MSGEIKMYFQQPGDTPVSCSSCEWTGTHTDLNMITDFEMRVTPGEPCPAGECPKCAALAHNVKGQSFDVLVTETVEYTVRVQAESAEAAEESAIEVIAEADDLNEYFRGVKRRSASA